MSWESQSSRVNGQTGRNASHIMGTSGAPLYLSNGGIGLGEQHRGIRWPV